MKFAMIFFPIAALLFIFYIAIKTEHNKEKSYENVSYGTMTTLNYNGHSYIGWSYGYKGGLVHDPDCKCGAHK